MKDRRHHNNTGLRQIKNGKTQREAEKWNRIYTNNAVELLIPKEEIMRPTKDTYYLGIASMVLKRGTCLRRNYGAVLVNNDQIVGTGYTGSPRGEVNCCDIKVCPRDTIEASPGEYYEICKSVHAEMNAIIAAGRDKTMGATLYVVGYDIKKKLLIGVNPCSLCSRIIKNAGIDRVVIY